MLDFEKPKLECVEMSENYGRFVVEPLERGFGMTLGVRQKEGEKSWFDNVRVYRIKEADSVTTEKEDGK